MIRALMIKIGIIKSHGIKVHEHLWVVQWNDDDACHCGTWKRYPSGVIYNPEVKAQV